MAVFKDIINSHPKVIVDFYASWCGPCRTLGPILEDVKRSVGDQVKIVKVDVDKHQALAAQMGVRGVPSLFFYENGKLSSSASGVLAKHEILARIGLS